MRYDIYAYNKNTGVDIGYMESFDNESEALLKIKELKLNEKFNKWDYEYKIYQSINKTHWNKSFVVNYGNMKIKKGVTMMNIKLTFNIEIDENQYKNLKKSYIKELAKEAEADGSIIDYIKQQVNGSLEVENFEKSK